MSDFFKPAPEPPTELGRYRVLSSTAGVRVSPLCLGAMSIGDAWKFMGNMSKEQSFKLLDAFYEAGGNFIDTAVRKIIRENLELSRLARPHSLLTRFEGLSAEWTHH